ncbi:MAG: hypothetical protein ACYTFQ_32900 [Planctomycetota bacterium]|jgi:hypothetical protein
MSHPKIQFYLTDGQERIMFPLLDLVANAATRGKPGALIAQVGYTNGIPTAHVTFVPRDKVKRINEILKEKEKPNEVQTDQKTGG